MTTVTDDIERMMVDSVARFAEGGGVARARALRGRHDALEMLRWQEMAELGWPSVCVPETAGGLGLGVRQACLLVETVGRSLVPEPLVSSIAAAWLLSRLGADAEPDLDALLAGRGNYVPLAMPEIGLPRRFEHVADCYRDTILLPGGEAPSGFVVGALAARAPQVEIAHTLCVDGSAVATIDYGAYARGALRVLSKGDAAAAIFARAMDVMRLGYSAYLVGLMDEALRLTLDYMSKRRQFGVPIASFQALQHRAASAYVDIAACRDLVLEACHAFDGPWSAKAAAAAKARASAAALRVTKECVQFHGAIGFTDECDIGLYLRTAMAVAGRLGGTHEHCLRYAKLPGRVPIAS